MLNPFGKGIPIAFLVPKANQKGILLKSYFCMIFLFKHVFKEQLTTKIQYLMKWNLIKLSRSKRKFIKIY
jgi:hypothetical protein